MRRRTKTIGALSVILDASPCDVSGNKGWCPLHPTARPVNRWRRTEDNWAIVPLFCGCQRLPAVSECRMSPSGPYSPQLRVLPKMENSRVTVSLFCADSAAAVRRIQKCPSSTTAHILRTVTCPQSMQAIGNIQPPRLLCFLNKPAKKRQRIYKRLGFAQPANLSRAKIIQSASPPVRMVDCHD